MAFYETVWITRQDLSETQVSELTEKFKNVITEYKGSVAHVEYWGLKKLAYPIKKNNRGHYTMFIIDATAEAIDEMSRQMRLNEDILRHMNLSTKTLNTEPSVMMQAPKGRYDKESSFSRERSA